MHKLNRGYSVYVGNEFLEDGFFDAASVEGAAEWYALNLSKRNRRLGKINIRNRKNKIVKEYEYTIPVKEDI